MANQFKINEEIVENILQKVLQPKSPHNGEHIFKILMRELPNHAKEIILHLSLSSEDYNPVSIGDYVKFTPPSYHAGSEFEWDVLEDIGLSPGNNMVYAKIMGDSSWGNADFNPFYSGIKIEVLYHDDDKKLKMYTHTADPMDLTIVSESDIKYFDILDADVLLDNALNDANGKSISFGRYMNDKYKMNSDALKLEDNESMAMLMLLKSHVKEIK